MQDNCVLKQINNGAIDYYYGFKFDTKLMFEKLVDSINEKTNLLLEQYFAAVKSAFQKDVKEAARSTGFNANLIIKGLEKDAKKNKIAIEDIHNVMESIELERTDSGFKLNAIPKIQKTYSTVV